MANFLSLVLSSGLPGLIAGAAVLALVFLASIGKLTVTGDQKRIANIVLSILLAGVPLLETPDRAALASAISAVASALVYEGVSYLVAKLSPSPKGMSAG